MVSRTDLHLLLVPLPSCPVLGRHDCSPKATQDRKGGWWRPGDGGESWPPAVAAMPRPANSYRVECRPSTAKDSNFSRQVRHIDLCVKSFHTEINY